MKGMRKRIGEKFIKIVGLMILSLVMVGYYPMQVFAVENESFYPEKEGEFAFGCIEMERSFIVDKDCEASINIFVKTQNILTLKLVDDGGTVLETKSFTREDGVFDSQTQEYLYNWQVLLKENTQYNLKFKFEDSTNYRLQVYRPKVQLNATEMTVTEGFTENIEVLYGDVAKWISSNSKIAKVKAGKVTGVKVGSATVTAVMLDGTEVSCDVVVKKNVMSRPINATESNKFTSQVYNISYDSKGNLVLKVRITNTTSNNIVNGRASKIVIKTASGKEIGNYVIKAHGVKVKANSHKDYTYKISKAKLKIKKADLRKAVLSK